MENTAVGKLKSPSSWLTNRCRDLVFTTLNSIDNAELIIIENKQRHSLGSPTATLSATIQINDPSVYVDFVRGGSIKASEAYITQKWTSPDLTQVIRFFARCQQQLDKIEQRTAWVSSIKNTLFHWFNSNTETGSKKNILAHYDLGNDLYTRFLDPKMMYSAAIYPEADSGLDDAQSYKLDTICQKLDLQPNDKVIEIGTGWGGMAIYAATHYGCHVTTTTISDAQYDYAKNKIAQLGLQDKITLLKQDYRLLEGKFDKLISIEMIEAVGDKYLPTFFKKCNDLLKEQGRMLIQSITIADQRYQYYLNNVDFIQRYIFPGGCLPSVSVMNNQIAQSTNMVVDNIQDIGFHYATTLKDWRERFNDSWPELQNLGYDNQFKRLWNYYLCYCEGGFLERAISTVHLVARKPNDRLSTYN